MKGKGGKSKPKKSKWTGAAEKMGTAPTSVGILFFSMVTIINHSYSLGVHVRPVPYNKQRRSSDRFH